MLIIGTYSYVVSVVMLKENAGNIGVKSEQAFMSVSHLSLKEDSRSSTKSSVLERYIVKSYITEPS